MRLFLLLCLCLLPVVTEGAVLINEVAWMGTSASANDEWIELYNNGGSSASLDGWSLKDGMNLNIPLSGTISAGQYAVLERTDDGSAEGSAFLIYTGALANTGAVLSLYRSDNSLEDQVAGGENWENIGGDNVTKETAHYTSSGWVTAEATPGKASPSYSPPDDEEEEDGEDGQEEDDDEEPEANKVDNSEGDGKTIELKIPDVALSLLLNVPDIVYVNQRVDFSVEPKGLGDTIMDSLQYQWNFGDLATSSGKKTAHTFTDAGEYVVTVHGVFSRHEQIARKTVKVLPVAFSLSRKNNGDILIHNNAKYEVAISGYKLKGTKKFTFPDHSILLPQASITVPKSKIDSVFSLPVTLFDQKGTMVASTYVGYTPQVALEKIVMATPVQKIQIAPPITKDASFDTANASNFLFGKSVASSGTTTASTAKVPSFNGGTVLNTTINKGQIPKNALPYLGLCAVLGLCIFTVFASRTR